ncbi:hypothetical protein VNI00_018130 [Paramarasmius palmivorus]|uniref:F-box domain-containing protein n=1 Tax=Paramarasmius palmivorus TaxID=297713 RepID=A0AAW0B136_9AGAR
MNSTLSNVTAVPTGLNTQPTVPAPVDRVPPEILDQIISLALPPKIVIPNPLAPSPPRENRTYLDLVHVSHNFRVAMLNNSANFTTLSLTMPRACHHHSDNDLSFLGFVLSCAGERPLSLTITLVNANGYQDATKNHRADGLCPCIGLILQHHLQSLRLLARECATIADFIVTRGLNRSIFTQSSLQNFEICTRRAADGWSVVRFLDILATRRFAGNLTIRIPAWIDYEATSLKAVLPLISSLQLSCCPHGLQHILPTFPSLQRLVLVHSAPSYPSTNTVSSQCITLNKLQCLELHVNHFPDSGINTIIRSLQAPRLTTLSIEWAHESGSITPGFVHALERVLSRSRTPIRHLTWIERRSGPYTALDNPSPLHPMLVQMLMRLGLDPSIYQYQWVEDNE